MKHCNSCNTTKDDSEFHMRKASIDGLSAKCKDCQRLYDKQRDMDPHRVEARKAYAKTDEGKAASRKGRKAWIERNPRKHAATNMVYKAVRNGRLTKPNRCERCKSNKKRLHGHNDDYSRPLVVRWLCSGCYVKWHKENGEGINAR